MKSFLSLCLLLVVVPPVRAAAAPVLPAGDFTMLIRTSGVALSPDGKTLAYEMGDDRERDRVLVLRNWETGQVKRIGANAGASTPVWVNAKRLVFGQGASVDVDGADLVPSGDPPHSILFNRFAGERADEVLVLRYDRPVMGRYQPFFILPHPRVFRVNTRQALAVPEIDNPGKVTGWMVDAQGVIRIAVETEGTQDRVRYRESASGAWRVPKGLDWAKDQVRPLWLSGDGKLLYLALVTPAGRWGLHTYDLGKEEVGDLVLSHDLYDMWPFATPVLAPKTRDLLGVQYLAERPRVLWFDPHLAAAQKAIDASLPRMINTVTSLSDDLQRMVVRSRSARDPGTYYQFDLGSKELKPLFATRPWLKPAQMAEVFPASFKSSDGLTIRGYLTVPAGREPKNLPLIVFPHDGPWMRDAGEFDAEAQFLANRGYAVLQINYRGSQGYGQAFYEKGKRRIGREVQRDIAEAAKWAIEKGIADPARIGILGHGFGGYSALIGVTQNPGLYRCAVSIDGVTDWAAHIAYMQQLLEAGHESMKEHFGDPKADAAELAEISPINHVKELSAPVLVIFGNDERVPRESARAYLAALRREKKPHEGLTFFDAMEGIRHSKVAEEYFAKIENFFAQHLGSGQSPATK